MNGDCLVNIFREERPTAKRLLRNRKKRKTTDTLSMQKCFIDSCRNASHAAAGCSGILPGSFKKFDGSAQCGGKERVLCGRFDRMPQKCAKCNADKRTPAK